MVSHHTVGYKFRRLTIGVRQFTHIVCQSGGRARLSGNYARQLKRLLQFASVATALSAVCLPASAHVVLANAQSSPGNYYKAVFSAAHGCKGSPTVRIRIRIPDGVIAVKPQPKPGWKLETSEGDYPKAYSLHGAQVSSGVREVSWAGLLPDAYFDEFVFQAYLSNDLRAGGVVLFPVVQECEQGVTRWIDAEESSATPAPRLKLVPKP